MSVSWARDVYKRQGPLLITHWGMSGPAILKASSFGARELSEQNYNFEIQINWVDQTNTELLFEQLQEFSQLHPQKGIGNQKVFPALLPIRVRSLLRRATHHSLRQLF